MVFLYPLWHNRSRFMKKAVLFDCDGVLIDSERYYLDGTMQWLKEMGVDATDADIIPIIGTTYKQTIEILMGFTKESYQQTLARNEDYFTKHPLPFDRLVKPHVYQLMEQLKSMDIKMAICTSSPVRDLNRIIESTGFDRYVHYYVSGDELKASKPEPGIYLQAANKLMVEPKDCLVVEDSPIGIQAGKAAGMTTIALVDTRLNLDTHQADGTINDMIEVISWVKQ